MAKYFFPFEAGPGASVTENYWSRMASQWLASGVVYNVGDRLQVYADATGMQVKIRPGAAWIRGHYFESDAQEILAIPASHPTLPRIDRIIIRLNWANNTIDFAVLQGVPATNPTPPSLTQSSSIWEIALAQVLVSPAVSTIEANKITDERQFVSHLPPSTLTRREYLYASPTGYGWSADIGGAETPKQSAYIQPTTTYTNVIAPSSGKVKITGISLLNTYGSANRFFLRLTSNGVAMLEMSKRLLAGDVAYLAFPLYLSANQALQARVATDPSSSNTTAVFASLLPVENGESMMLSLSGSTFATLLSVPSGKTYLLEAFAISNASATTQTISISVWDDGIARAFWQRLLPPNAVYFLQTDLVLSAGWIISGAWSSSSGTGRIILSYSEVMT